MSKYKTLGRIEAVWNKLGGEEGVDRFLRGELEVTVKAVVATVFALWKTLIVGMWKSVADIRTALTASNMRLGDWAADILDRVSLPTESETVEFGRVTVKDLGFTKNTPLRDILAAIKALGHKLCLPEDGAVLRVGYPEQPRNETVWLAMKPAKGSDGRWYVLCVNRNAGVLWLYAYCYGLDDIWGPGDEFFFRK
jgi:hypothetical protein